MKKKTRKKLLSFVIAAVILFIVVFFGLHERPVAVFAAYSTAIWYLDQGFPLFQDVRYMEWLGDYVVTFKLAGSGEEREIYMFPKWFPVLHERNTFIALERSGYSGG